MASNIHLAEHRNMVEGEFAKLCISDPIVRDGMKLYERLEKMGQGHALKSIIVAMSGRHEMLNNAVAAALAENQPFTSAEG